MKRLFPLATALVATVLICCGAAQANDTFTDAFSNNGAELGLQIVNDPVDAPFELNFTAPVAFSAPVSFAAPVVPEPSSAIAFLTGIVGLFGYATRRRS